MRILILGRNGQVGLELQRSLAGLGDILALGRAEVDLEDPASIKTAIEIVAPDVVVNASAYTAVDKAETDRERANRVNHLAVGEIGEIAAARGAWVIHYSTDYVFDGAKASAYSEHDATNPLNVYGTTKLAGERALAGSGARHLIFRTSWVHSGSGTNFIRTMIRLAMERDTLRVVSDQVGAPTGAQLIADITAAAIVNIGSGRSPDPGIYHLAAMGETSWHGLAEFALAEALARGAPLKADPGAIGKIATVDYPTPATRPRNSRLNTAKLRSAFEVDLPDWRPDVIRSVESILETSGPNRQA